jgi:autotransporter-associated beta strand protein
VNLYDAGGVAPLSVNGTYTLFDYSSAFSGSLSNLSIANSQIGKFYSLTNDSLNTRITLTVADTTVTEWNGGAANGLWSTPANWSAGVPNAAGAVAKLGTIPIAPTTISVDGPKTVGGILFDNGNSYSINGTASDTLTLSNGFAAASITVTNGNHTIAAPVILVTSANATTSTGTSLTISGNISGAQSLIVSGSGSTILLGANSYGSTTINGGVLNVGNNGTIGTLGTGDVMISPGGTLVFQRSDNITIENNILGGGAQVTKLGSGTLTLTGSNTFATDIGAAFNINAGTVKAGSASALAGGVMPQTNTFFPIPTPSPSPSSPKSFPFPYPPSLILLIPPTFYNYPPPPSFTKFS